MIYPRSFTMCLQFSGSSIEYIDRVYHHFIDIVYIRIGSGHSPDLIYRSSQTLFKTIYKLFVKQMFRSVSRMHLSVYRYICIYIVFCTRAFKT